MLTAVIFSYLTRSCASSYNWVELPITTVSIETVFTACESSARELAEQIRISETVPCTVVTLSTEHQCAQL